MISRRVAVITRTKNRIDLLRRCMASVRQQTCQDYVQVIVNDGGDHTALQALVAEFEARPQSPVVLVHNESSVGRWGAANVGVRSVDSKLVTLLDDDDTWDAQFLDTLTQALDNRPSDRMRGVVCQTRIIEERTENGLMETVSQREFNPDLREVSLFDLAAKNLFTVNGFVYERRCFEQLAGYRQELPVLGDWDFNLRFLQEFDVDVVPEALCNWHIRIDSTVPQSVSPGTSTHQKFTNLLRNEYLRADLKRGVFGMGTLIAVAVAFNCTRQEVRAKTRSLAPLNKLLDRLRPW
jgi:glycosyltransferase involved in cell wall biosynthesis